MVSNQAPTPWKMTPVNQLKSVTKARILNNRVQFQANWLNLEDKQQNGKMNDDFQERVTGNWPRMNELTQLLDGFLG